jgi:hypothetical protein
MNLSNYKRCLNSLALLSRGFKFLIDLFSLSVGHTYVVELVVTYAVSGASSSSSVEIIVSSSDVVVVLSTGSEISLRVGDELTIDGSKSYDEDVESVTGQEAGLLFSWSCELIYPLKYAEPCGLKLPPDVTTEQLSLVAPAFLPDTEKTISRISLSVRRTASEINESSSVKSVLISVLPSLSPFIFASCKSQIIAQETLFISAYVELSAVEIGEWKVDDGSLNLTDIALTPTKYRLSEGENFYNLVISRSSLQSGCKYKFLLTVGLAKASVEVYVVEAPHAGALDVILADDKEIFPSVLYVASG